jgi:hypothetical protein
MCIFPAERKPPQLFWLDIRILCQLAANQVLVFMQPCQHIRRSKEYLSMIQRARRLLLTLAFLGFGLAMAQTEPSLTEVYAAAQAGNLNHAQALMEQVLILHPKSAKAYFVQSELFARQGNLLRARAALASAEEFAPGLPFAKPESVRALRAQLSTKNTSGANQVASPNSALTPDKTASLSWGLPLLLAGAVIVAGFFLFRNKRAAPYAPQTGNTNPGGLSGPQSFGTGGSGAMQPGYAQSGGSGLGGNIMGGLTTGLAVGAGVMAAQAIGRKLMGNRDQFSSPADRLMSNTDPNISSNPGMGGADFGVNDASAWDDLGASDIADSGNWDN